MKKELFIELVKRLIKEEDKLMVINRKSYDEYLMKRVAYQRILEFLQDDEKALKELEYLRKEEENGKGCNKY